MGVGRIIILAAALLVASAAGCRAQEQYKFRTLSPKGGFYYDGVKSVAQDADGFIWILMDNELQRFDGYSYKRYYPRFRELMPGAQWNFAAMATDPAGRLYVTTNNGLFTYNRTADSFEKLLDGSAYYISCDRAGNLWVDMASRTYRIDPVTLAPDTLACDGRPVGNIWSHHATEEYIYMGATQGRLYRYGYGPGRFELFHKFPDDRTVQGLAAAGGWLWAVTSRMELYALDEGTGAVTRQYDLTPPGSGPQAPPRDLLADKYGRLWIATQAGIRVFDPATETDTLLVHSAGDMFSIPNSSVWCLFEDDRRNVWAGTFSGGLCMADLDDTEMFRTYTPATTALSHGTVSAFAEDGSTVWTGTEGGGLNRFQRGVRVVTGVLSSRGGGGPASDHVKSVVTGPSGELYIGTFLGGLDIYDPATGRFTNHRAGRDNGLLDNSIRKLVRDDRGVWIIYQTNTSVVTFYSFPNRTFTHHYFDRKDNGWYLLDMARGEGGDLWILSSKNLYLFDTETMQARSVLGDRIPYLNGQSMCLDWRGEVWIGTVGHGLVRYSPSDGGMEVIEGLEELNISAVYSIIADDSGDVWMGTDNGLVKYDTAGGRFYRFDETDGLQGQVYYPLACMKASDGVLFFGGTNGFTAVKPETIRRNPHPPRVIISEFLLDNAPGLPPFRRGGGYGSGEIVLPYTQTNFGFRISADNYMIPEKNTFRYRLAGYDNRWVTADASGRNVLFTKMPAGSYRFEVQAANNDGVWGPVTAVSVRRRAAPWATGYAYLLYACIAGAAAFAVLRFHRQRKELRMELYRDRLEREQKEEIHQTQLRFFTNISHDFRTPLSLIQGVVDNLRDNEALRDYYRILHGNTRRLLDLVNELLDFRTLQHGKMSLQVRPLDLNRLTESISADFGELARRRRIRFVRTADPSLPHSVYADRQVAEKILMNLLNNAFKYTPEGGEIRIETYGDSSLFRRRHGAEFTVGDPELEGVAVAVRDTGVGISAASIATVFERYYNVKSDNLSSHLGTGIGLALTKSLVELHKGRITIYSTRGQGTDMLVVLPADATVYTPDQFAAEPSHDRSATDGVAAEAGNRLVEDIRRGEAHDVLLRERKRILLAEDNDDLRRLVADFLASHYDVEQAPNGWVAARYLQDHEVSLVISDIMMPLKDGVTLCRELKNSVDTSHIPFIMLTARTGTEARLEGAESGADYYFEKPVDLNLLLLTVRNLFDRQEKLREHYARNYYVDSAELAANEKDNAFLKKLVEIIDANLTQPVIDVHLIASEMTMSRTKLYSKLKSLTGRSIVEFTLNYRLRKAARLMIEEDLSMKEVMERIGIRSQSYFTNTFKKEFGQTPAAFARQHNRSNKR